MMNVFHAGDGNLHPLIVFDAPRAGHLGARARAPATRSSRACVAAGGVLSGEHGIGLEKRERDAAHLQRPTTSTRRRGSATRSIPTGRANPQKVLPRGSRCGELQRVPEGAWI